MTAARERTSPGVVPRAHHRWWHAGDGWRKAFCLFCGALYGDALVFNDEPPCPSPLAIGGEQAAQRILAEVRHV